MTRKSLVVAVVALAACVGRMSAQGQMPSSTRVAIVNIGQVFAKYDKAQKYKSEMDELLKPYRVQAEKLKAGFEAWQTALKNATKAEEKAKCQEGLLAHQRAMEDLDRTMKEKVGKKQTEQIVTLYRDVSDAVTGYAKANGIHLVLAYGEQLEGDRFNFANIDRVFKGMDLGSAHPLFFGGGLDISMTIAETLNQRYRTVPGIPASLPKN